MLVIAQIKNVCCFGLYEVAVKIIIEIEIAIQNSVRKAYKV